MNRRNKKRFFYTIAIVAFFCIVGCESLRSSKTANNPWSQDNLQSMNLAATSVFDHEDHKIILEKDGFNCITCHPFNVILKSQHDKLSEEIATFYLKPGQETCHYCHNDLERKASTPLRCLKCHRDDMNAIKPAVHTTSWEKDHRILSRVSGETCQLCHTQSYCVDCHMRRDTVQSRVHDGNYLFYHSVEARVNPMKCGSCHRQNFCMGCHRQLLRR